MSKFLKPRSHKAGLPPGSLVHIGEIKPVKVRISLMEYDEKNVLEKDNLSAEDCLDYIISPSITWIQVNGVYDIKMIESLGNSFQIHPLILEDILNTGQRAKLDLYKNHLFIVMRMLSYNGGNQIFDEQVSLILGNNVLISFVEKDIDIFGPIRERIRNGNNRIRKMGTDYLLYAILDMIIDNYFVILERLDGYLEKLEENIIKEPNPQSSLQIQKTKRELTLLRKTIWPTREVVSQLQRVELPLMSPGMQVYLKDLYDHSIQAIDTIESFRDLTSGMLDIYISNINLRMNEIMKVLTVMATVFVPLTFIASIYGMNFDYMPELRSEWGYYTVLGVMAFIVVGMLGYFKYKKWF